MSPIAPKITPEIADQKALRRLVIELAATTPEDIVAVLAMLDPRARAAVQGLLAAYTDLPDIFEMALPPPANTSGLSDWLVARTRGQSPDGGEFRITPGTADALRTIVAAMPGAGRGEGSGRRPRFDGAGA